MNDNVLSNMFFTKHISDFILTGSEQHVVCSCFSKAALLLTFAAVASKAQGTCRTGRTLGSLRWSDFYVGR